MDGLLLLTIAFITALAALVTPASTAAQGYPNRPLRLIVPATPGGQVDIVARVIGQKLTESWGQKVIVDNRPGAGSNIGTEIAARAAPDGYTITMASIGPFGANPSLFANLPFDPVRDFAPIILAVSTTNILVVHPALPARSLREMLNLTKANPGKFSYASAGTGTSMHLFMEVLKMTAQLDIVHVPYKGSAPGLADVMSGQVMMMFDSMPSALPQIKAGRLRALAVSSGKRSSAAPEVPTVAEAGFAEFDFVSWLGLAAPAGTPKEIVSALNLEINRILRLPDVRERLNSLGSDPLGSTPEEFGVYIKSQVAIWSKVVKASGARAD